MNSLISLALFFVMLLAKGCPVTGYNIYSVPFAQIDEDGSAKIVCSFKVKYYRYSYHYCQKSTSCNFALYYKKTALDLSDANKYSIETQRTSVFRFLYEHSDIVKDDVVSLAESHNVDFKGTSNLVHEVKMVTIKNAAAGRYKCEIANSRYYRATITVLPSSDTIPSKVIHFSDNYYKRAMLCVVMGGDPIWKISLQNDWITWKSGNITAQSELVSESVLFYDKLSATSNSMVGTVTCEVANSVAKSRSKTIDGSYRGNDFLRGSFNGIIFVLIFFLIVPIVALMVIVASFFACVRAKISHCCTKCCNK